MSNDGKDPWGTGGNSSGSNGSGNNGPKNQGPWGKPPSGGNNNTPPELEEIIRKGQQKLKEVMPGGFGPLGFIIVVALLFVGWLATGIYIVQPAEQGVVLRFGKAVSTSLPGINYHLPYPIETVLTPNVLTVRQTSVGSNSRTGQNESHMLTGDENIVDVNFTVFWRIKSDGATDYLFNVQQPASTVKMIAESAIREVVGRSNLQPILTQARQKTEEAVFVLMQSSLDFYVSGIEITQVQLQKVEAPAEVIDSFNDVQAARIDQERMVNEAHAYSNQVIPQATGNAQQIVQRAEAYKQSVVAEATGQAARFISVYEEYAKAPQVTRDRIYLETLERIYMNTNKIILDSEGSNGIVPYLPLNELIKTNKGTN
ncbi:MAG: FtsH protease activity modulator HflK [Rhizobiales bacterium]|nr:FtsH protease activity modulator HflK [Hyphomicrobiales bacterium]NRB13946.1 FtsH protease activity modulator HflK [Hyphomicrobiales bacterium]